MKNKHSISKTTDQINAKIAATATSQTLCALEENFWIIPACAPTQKPPRPHSHCNFSLLSCISIVRTTLSARCIISKICMWRKLVRRNAHECFSQSLRLAATDESGSSLNTFMQRQRQRYRRATGLEIYSNRVWGRDGDS